MAARAQKLKRIAAGDYRCPCGETDRAAFFPSHPYSCKACHTAQREARRETPEGLARAARQMAAWYARHPGYHAAMERARRERLAAAGDYRCRRCGETRREMFGRLSPLQCRECANAYQRSRRERACPITEAELQWKPPA